nr:2134_t:CDS:2 [Entrophospora candida]
MILTPFHNIDTATKTQEDLIFRCKREASGKEKKSDSVDLKFEALEPDSDPCSYETPIFELEFYIVLYLIHY